MDPVYFVEKRKLGEVATQHEAIASSSSPTRFLYCGRRRSDILTERVDREERERIKIQRACARGSGGREGGREREEGGKEGAMDRTFKLASTAM